MYESHFNLRQRPFASVPRADHFFPAARAEAARAALVRCVERAEGVGMVIGAAGTGKTLLCQVVADQVKNSLQVALLTGGRVNSRRALLQAVLYELAQPYRGMDEGELRLALTDYLTLSEDCPNGVALLVDEAHHLPLRLLDEIRGLTNLTRGNQPAVRLVLAGGRVLEERFSTVKLESFQQRITARCYLEAFDRCETQDYIHARIKASGGRGPRIFPPETCQSVYKATDGVPRLINQVCDHAMLLAYAAGRRQLEPAHVEEAWADLQQLPTPWTEPCPESGGVIEFGGLEDDAEDATGAEATAAPATGDGEGPALRISPEVEETGPGDLPPAEQVRHIQQMLADAEEEFEPAGSIGPEVELAFDEPERPFREEFAHEEVVADRCVPPRRKQPIAPPSPNDAQEPVVEQEHEEDTPPCPARPVSPVRRHNYGRLFASLRRG